MNIKPGAWVIINSGLALRHTDCGVTPQPQNTGISPACIVEASPKSGLEISLIPIYSGLPIWIGAPWVMNRPGIVGDLKL